MKQEITYEARAEFLKGSSEIGVLVIHGFTGSTQSMRPIAYALHEAGYTINMPRLKGHGTSPEDMNTTGSSDWIESVKSAYDEIRPLVKKLYVVGLSMGGALSLYCAIYFRVEGVITINAAINLPEFEKLYKDDSLPAFIDGVGSDIKKAGIREWAYGKTPKKCIGDILHITDIVREYLPKIYCPALIFKATEDHVVPPDNQDYIFRHIGSADKQLIELKNSYHVATLDNDQQIIIGKTKEFIESH